MCTMTHSYVCHDVFCAMSHFGGRYSALISDFCVMCVWVCLCACVTSARQEIAVCCIGVFLQYVAVVCSSSALETIACVAWLIRTCTINHSYVCHDVFFAVSHSYVWCDSPVCVCHDLCVHVLCLATIRYHFGAIYGVLVPDVITPICVDMIKYDVYVTWRCREHVLFVMWHATGFATFLKNKHFALILLCIHVTLLKFLYDDLQSFSSFLHDAWMWLWQSKSASLSHAHTYTRTYVHTHIHMHTHMHSHKYRVFPSIPCAYSRIIWHRCVYV